MTDSPPLGPSALRRRSVRQSGVALDLKDPDLHCGTERYSVFVRLRRDEPVYWNPETDSTGFWAVTRYEDVLRVVQDPETFSADVRNGGMRIFNIQDVTQDPRPHLLSLDPPRHTQLRRALLPLFGAEAVARLEPRIRLRASRLIDAIAPAGACDFVTAVAQPLTLGLLTDLLEVPEEDAALLVRWSNIFIGDDDPDYQPSLEERQQAIREADAYSRALYEDRRGSARSDFVTLLAGAKVDGLDMDFETFSVNFCAFIIAANETTRHAITATVLELSDNPAQRKQLIEDPSLMPAAVKELIRLSTPLMHVRRTATRNVMLGDKHIRKGDKVVVWYNSANRDEGVWRDAAACDVSRFHRESERPMVAFGAGPHHCLGWRFAELQLRVVLEVLLSRLPDFHVAGNSQRLRSNFISGFKRLPVSFTPR